MRAVRTFPSPTLVLVCAARNRSRHPIGFGAKPEGPLACWLGCAGARQRQGNPAGGLRPTFDSGWTPAGGQLRRLPRGISRGQRQAVVSWGCTGAVRPGGVLVVGGVGFMQPCRMPTSQLPELPASSREAFDSYCGQ